MVHFQVRCYVHLSGPFGEEPSVLRARAHIAHAAGVGTWQRGAGSVVEVAFVAALAEDAALLHPFTALGRTLKLQRSVSMTHSVRTAAHRWPSAAIYWMIFTQSSYRAIPWTIRWCSSERRASGCKCVTWAWPTAAATGTQRRWLSSSASWRSPVGTEALGSALHQGRRLRCTCSNRWTPT